MLDIITNLLGVVSAAATRQVAATMVTIGGTAIGLLVVAAILYQWSRGEKQRLDEGYDRYGDDIGYWLAVGLAAGALLLSFVLLLSLTDYIIAFDYKVLIAMRNLLR